MKKRLSRVMGAGGIACALALSLAGCAPSSEGVGAREQGAADQQAEQAETATDGGSAEMDLEFTKRDLDASYDEAQATRIALADDGVQVQGSGAAAEGASVTLNAAGTYILSGSLSNGSIVVAAGDEDKLQIVLDGASIHNEAGPALLVENADKCFVTLAEGSQNALSDGEAYQLEGEDDDRDAVVFSRDDLTFNGAGALSVTGSYKHAICSNDDLVITGGTFDVTSVEDAFRGKDCIKVADGSFTVNAGDDAFHTDAYLYLKGGTVDVESCYEGYEGEQVIIDGGEHRIVASDDALNAALSDSDATDGAMLEEAPGRAAVSGDAPADDRPFGAMPNGGGMGEQMVQSSDECLIQINGGTLDLSAGNDGIDSNGNVEINGGVVCVSGPNRGMDGSLDYDLSGAINGGTVLMVGSVGSTKGLDASAQAVAYGNVSGKAGQEVALMDADGTVLVTLVASADFANVLASASEIGSGQTFAVSVDGVPMGLVMGEGLDMMQNGGIPAGRAGMRGGMSA